MSELEVRVTPITNRANIAKSGTDSESVHKD
jgi:hypothetical protein